MPFEKFVWLKLVQKAVETHHQPKSAVDFAVSLTTVDM